MDSQASTCVSTADAQVTGAGGTSSGNDNGHLKPKKAKKSRFTTSCLPCQRRKRKCDNASPCESCLKRGEESQCEYAVVKFEDGSTAQLEHAKLKQRVVALEAALSQLQSKVDNLPTQIQTQSPVYSSDSQSEMPFQQLLPLQQQQFSSLAILNQVPQPMTSTSLTPVSANATNEGQIFQEDHMDEAEVAAILLENKTLGREQYGLLGSNARQVLLANILTAADQSPGSATASLVPYPPTNGSLTTILLAHEPSEASEADMAFLLSAVPSRRDSDFLVDEFLKDVHYIYNVIHRPSFQQEVGELWTCIAEGNTSRIDPAWLSLYFMILCWASSTLNPAKRQIDLQKYAKAGKKDLPEFWRNAVQRALRAADWVARPQIRTLQTISLLLNWQTVGSFNQVTESSSFGVWLAAGIRIAQSLNLHKLPSNDPTFLMNDPAFPSGSSAIKAEVCKRLWCLLVSFDWLFCTRSGTSMVRKGTFTTPPPLKVNDEDITLSTEAHSRPFDQLTETDFHLVRMQLAEHQIAMSEFLETPNKSYEVVCELDAALQNAARSLPSSNFSANGRCKPIFHTVVTCMLHNRIVRLHRPFLVRGLESPNSKYAYSARACISSARTICDVLDNDTESETVLYWYIYGQVLGAVICLFIDHYCANMHHGAIGRGLLSNDKSLAAARRFFSRGAASWSRTLNTISRQALLVMDQFVVFENQLPSDNRAPSLSLHKQMVPILKQIAAAVDGSNALTTMSNYLNMTPQASTGIPVSAAGAPSTFDEFFGYDFSQSSSLSDNFGGSPMGTNVQPIDWSTLIGSDLSSTWKALQFPSDIPMNPV